jgi:hypothetical protein
MGRKWRRARKPPTIILDTFITPLPPQITDGGTLDVEANHWVMRKAVDKAIGCVSKSLDIPAEIIGFGNVKCVPAYNVEERSTYTMTLTWPAFTRPDDSEAAHLICLGRTHLLVVKDDGSTITTA